MGTRPKVRLNRFYLWEIILEISPGVEITSIITKSSAETLGLAPGKEVYAVVKSSDVMIAVD